MSGAPTFGRYAEVPVGQMPAEQRAGYRFLVDGPRGRLPGPWRSAYPTAAHEKRGQEVGLPAPTVEAIIAGLPASFADAREQVVYETAMALAGGHLVSQGLYDRAVKALGHESITDVIVLMGVLMGYYTAVSLTMNFYAVPAGTPGLTR